MKIAMAAKKKAYIGVIEKKKQRKKKKIKSGNSVGRQKHQQKSEKRRNGVIMAKTPWHGEIINKAAAGEAKSEGVSIIQAKNMAAAW